MSPSGTAKKYDVVAVHPAAEGDAVVLGERVEGALAVAEEQHDLLPAAVRGDGGERLVEPALEVGRAGAVLDLGEVDGGVAGSSCESAGEKSLVSDRVAAGVLTVQTLTRSSGGRAPATGPTMICRACWSGWPAWLAEVSTMTRTSRGRAGAASTVGLICQAKSMSPSRSW